jgi:thiosulfate/3-mercaptopyruvate sulfurtransferase
MLVRKTLFFISFIFVNLFAQTNYLQEDSMPPVISLKWMQKHIDNPNLVLIDVRTTEEFKHGHLKNAINLPTFKYLFDEDYNIPRLTFLKNTFSNAGIDNNSLVVVYGNNELIWAARFYWICKVLGHEKVGLLEIGYTDTLKKVLLVTTKIYKPKKTNFIPTVNNKILKTKLDVLLALNKEIIIDGRGEDFYNGLKSHAKRFGHIPTAINSPGSLNYIKTKTSSKMKTFSQLRELYKDLPKDKKIILYCEDGADAALNFLVLQQLGYNTAVYDGSWLEWGNDFKLPIVNPSKK